MKQILLTLLIAFAVAPVSAAKINLVLEFDGLEPMRGQHYEGWNIVHGQAFSTGRFAVSKSGSVYSVSAAGKYLHRVGRNGVAKFKVSRVQLKSTLFILTIEPNGDTDLGPSDSHVMGGDFKNRKATLSVEHDSSLATNFSSASGSFILAAPTGGNFNQGVWFVNPRSGKSALDLPKLPNGWAYEGWIVNTANGSKFSTGLFFNADAVDSDSAGRLAGPLKLSFPRVAGQDIVKSSVKLNDGVHAIVLSVEPYPDFDPAPYAIKILKSDLDASTPGMTPISLDNISSGLPHGKIHLH